MPDTAPYARHNVDAEAPQSPVVHEQHRSTHDEVVRVDSGIDSESLLRGRKTVAINHNGSTYRLQATRLGKLILTK